MNAIFTEDELNAFSPNKWGLLSYQPNLSDDFIDKYADKLNMNVVIRSNQVSDHILLHHRDKLSMQDWDYVISHRDVDMSIEMINFILGTYPQIIRWYTISDRNDIDDLLETHANNVNWDYLSKNQMWCTSHRLIRFANYLSWNLVSSNIFIEEDAIPFVVDKIVWMLKLQNQVIPTEIINWLVLEEFINAEEFYVACMFQKIDEDIIDWVSIELDLNVICRWIPLSKEFIIAHADKLDWKIVSDHQRISPDLYDKFHNQLPMGPNLKSNMKRWNRIIFLKNDKFNLNSDLFELIENFVMPETCDQCQC